MRLLPVLLLCALSTVTRAADPAPFEIKDGDRVLLIGDTLIEREGNYGYLETRMHEQFPDRKFTVRNLGWAGDTPLGWSRASFDKPEKGRERLKEQLALVRPTVAFIGYGMAASLQEMTDRSGDATLNPDPARYGAEPMTAARFKKELGMLMDAIAEAAGKAEHRTSNIEHRTSKEEPAAAAAPNSDTSKFDVRSSVFDVPPSSVRFVLLSPIRHEDLRAVKPGLPDPAEHNKLLEQYAKAIEELAKERGARFLKLFVPIVGPEGYRGPLPAFSENGIIPNEKGYREMLGSIFPVELGWGDESPFTERIPTLEGQFDAVDALRAAICKKNALFFHRWRPANSTYLFGFRKHEQGRNAAEIPQFDPLIEAAEAEIDRLKRTSPATGAAAPGSALVPSAGEAVPASRTSPDAPIPANAPATPDVAGSPPPRDAAASARDERATRSTPPAPTQPHPQFTVQEGYQIELWAENPLLEKPTQMNWDGQGRLWVCSSSLYPQIAPGEPAHDKILVLEDTDRDGKADKSTVFADGLLIPTGVEPDLGGGKAEHRTSNIEHRTSKDGAAVGAPPATESETSKFDVGRSMFDVPAACYVGQSTELLHLTDTDGDGKADQTRVVLSGFGTEDTHHIIHTLHWGPDGRLYFNQSVYIHSHLETPHGMVRLNSGGIFAYDPRTERVEVFARGWWNSWGHQMDKWGQSFATDGAGNSGISWVIPGAVYDAYEGSRKIAPRISPGSYPKFCGLELIYSPHFPAEWQGNAITCDFRAHRIVRFGLEDLSLTGNPPAAGDIKSSEGARAPENPGAAPAAKPAGPTAGYVAKEMPDFIRTSDLSFRPIDVKLGPDGALYIADWSNPIIQHGEVDFRDPRRDKHMGRIWRVTKKDAPLVKWEPLGGKKNEELLEGLLSGNLWEKEGARQTLITRDLERMSFALLKWGNDRTDEFSQIAMLGVLRALGVHSINDPYLRLIASKQGSGRAAVPRALGERVAIWRGAGEGTDRVGQMSVIQEETLPGLVADANPRVRLEAIRAMARIPTARSAELVLDAAVKQTSSADPFLDYAVWLSINELAKPWTDAIASGEWKIDGREKQLAWGLTAIPPALAGETLGRIGDRITFPKEGGPWIEIVGTAAGPRELRKLLLALADPAHFTTDASIRALDALTEAARVRNVRPEPIAPDDATLPDKLKQWVAKATPKPSSHDLHMAILLGLHEHHMGVDTPEEQFAPVRLRLTRLMGYWPPGLDGYLEFRLNEDPAPGMMAAAAEALARLGKKELLIQFAKPEPDGAAHVEGRQQALFALASLDPNAALAALQPLLLDPNATPAQPFEPGKDGNAKPAPSIAAAAPFWRSLFAAKGFTEAFVKALPKDFPKPAATAALQAARELGKKGEPLTKALAPLAGASTADAQPHQSFGWMVDFTKRDGDPARGELIYRRANLGCVMCHAIGGAGGKVGPDLTSLGASAPMDYIIESVLAPAAKVKENFNAVTLTLKDGTEVMGLPARETAQEIFLRNVTGQEQSVVKANIAKTTSIGSIMPAGVVDQLPERERWDLFAFLGELGKPGGLDASKGDVARVWTLSNEPPLADGTFHVNAATVNAFTMVDGRLTKEQLAESLPMVTQRGETPYAVTRFQAIGEATLNLIGAAEATLDGKPLPLANGSAQVAPGPHVLTVKIDRKNPPPVLRAGSTGVRFLGN